MCERRAGLKERVADTSKCGMNEVLKKTSVLNNGLESATCQQARTEVQDIQICKDVYKEFSREVEDVWHFGIGENQFTYLSLGCFIFMFGSNTLQAERWPVDGMRLAL